MAQVKELHSKHEESTDLSIPKEKKQKKRPESVPDIVVSPISKATSRYGRTLGQNRIFEKEPRWPEAEVAVGSPQFLLKPLRSEREAAFGTSTREDWGRILGIIPKTNPNAGPGSYRVLESMVLSSEMPRQPTIRFPSSVRPSMDLKTIGPGPIYDLEGKFKSGEDYPHKIKPSFNLDQRTSIVSSAVDAIYDPKLSKGVSCTIKKRHEPSLLKMSQMRSGPAPHDYDVVGSYNKLQRQPSFSFGKGSARFKSEDKVLEMMKQLEQAEMNAS